MKNFNTEIIDENLKGLCVYEKPFIFRVTEDKKRFYYSEIGVLVSCSFSDESRTTNIKHLNKFVLEVQYDYRSADDLENFGFVQNTGTYGEQFFCDTIEEAMQKTLDFLNSTFVNYRTFSRELIPQTKSATIREVAKSQCLHHLGAFLKYQDKDNFILNIIENAGETETLKKYVKRNEDRHQANLKFQSKLANRFLTDFNFDIQKVISRFRFDLGGFQKVAEITDFDTLNPKQKKTLKKALNYYNA